MNKKENFSPHGGDIYTNGLLKGRELIDYSSNINPFGIPGTFKNKLQEALEATTRYPDYKYRTLRKSIIEYHNQYDGVNLQEDIILLGNGASEILDLGISSIKNILIVVPSFIEYEDISKKCGANIEFSVLNQDMEYDYDDILSKLQRCEGMILGNPNNPSGNKINKEFFKNILAYCEVYNKKIIIDEAFVEFTSEGSSLLTWINEYKCLLIVRAITKFFGMPGVRFGYGITSNEQWINSMKSKQNPWNVNTFAEYAAIYSFKDKNYIEESKNWIREEIPYVLQKLKGLPFVDRVYNTNTNFVLVKLKGISGQELYNKCLDGNYVIRRANNFRTLEDNYVRFAIKDREKNQHFIRFLNDFI